LLSNQTTSQQHTNSE